MTNTSTELKTESPLNKPATIKSFLAQESVKKRFEEILGKRTNAFLSSVLALVNQSSMLKNASTESVYMCAMMAATLDLPVNSNLGFVYVIPYGKVAQFQISYRGFIQLALRSGQFKTISACPIFEGQIIAENPLTGFEFDFTKKTSEKIIGYAAYFSLLNGFEKTNYMTLEQVTAHGKRFSKTFNSGPWKTDFDAMALKTVTKALLNKYAPLSVEMQKAILADQSVINDVETMDVDYVDQGGAELTHEDLKSLYDLKEELLSEEEKIHGKRILDNKEVNSYKKLQELLKGK